MRLQDLKTRNITISFNFKIMSFFVVCKANNAKILTFLITPIQSDLALTDLKTRYIETSYNLWLMSLWRMHRPENVKFIHIF